MIKSIFHVTPEPHECVLVYRQGKRVAELRPGDRHRRGSDHSYVAVELRSRTLQLATQDVATADGLQVKASMSVRWRVIDPASFHEVDEHPQNVLYLAAQVALREVLGDLEAPVLVHRLRTDPTLSARAHAQVQAAVVELGIEVFEVVVRDIVMPAEVRRAQLDLVTAKARGQAQLEEARARTASLRALANGAKLLDDHPALARLQLVDAAPPGAEVRIVLGPDER